MRNRMKNKQTNEKRDPVHSKKVDEALNRVKQLESEYESDIQQKNNNDRSSMESAEKHLDAALKLLTDTQNEL